MTTKEKIVEAAVIEFSKGGYPGGRVESIAIKAGVNKAMIFYYFGSKEELYKVIINKIAGELFNLIKNISNLNQDPNPEKFFETLAENYILFFSKNRLYMKIIGTDLIQNPVNLKGALMNFFDSEKKGIPLNILNTLKEWYKQGKVTEPDPMHLFLNIISLCIFPLIARTFPEVLFDVDLNNEKFIEERIRSVKNILKRGILK